MEIKLPKYFVEGVLLAPGQFVDRYGQVVNISPHDNIEVSPPVPINLEHDKSQIVGFVTKVKRINVGCKHTLQSTQPKSL